MKKTGLNIQRILLFALVAMAFFGFLLWSIAESQQEQQSVIGGSQLAAQNNQATANAVIKVTLPKVNDAIKSPVAVAGEAAVFEAVLKVRIKDAKGLILAEQTVMTKEGQKMSPFGAQIKYKKPSAAKGTIEFSEPSPKDGSEIYKITIPVAFKD